VAGAQPLTKGWFQIDGVQAGDRTLESQLKGLEAAADAFRGRTVLDVGCAEGLIGRHCIDAWGARKVDGVTAVQSEIDAAEQLCAGRPMRFLKCDLRRPGEVALLQKKLEPQYDVLLLLSVLHKVWRPMELLSWVTRYARETVIIRLPAPIIDMERCRPGVHPVAPWMAERYDLVSEPETCIEPVTGKPEWMGVYKVRV